MFENVSRANNIQRAVLVTTILSSFFASLLTWDMVIYRRIATESSGWTAFFISNLGAFGLVISSSLYLGWFLGWWLVWVRLSKERRLGKLHNWILRTSVAFAMMAFVLAVFDLANDLLIFGFRSNVLLRFLKPPLIVVPILLAFLLAVDQICLKPKV